MREPVTTTSVTTSLPSAAAAVYEYAAEAARLVSSAYFTARRIEIFVDIRMLLLREGFDFESTASTLQLQFPGLASLPSWVSDGNFTQLSTQAWLRAYSRKNCKGSAIVQRCIPRMPLENLWKSTRFVNSAIAGHGVGDCIQVDRAQQQIKTGLDSGVRETPATGLGAGADFVQ